LHKFDKILIEPLYLRDQCKMLSKVCQIYDVLLLRISVSKL